MSYPIEPEGEEIGLLEEYYENCILSPGHLSINLQSVPSIDIALSCDSVVDCEWTLPVLFNLISFEDLFSLLCGLMHEKSIVFVSSNLDHVSSCVLGLISLMKPFKWQHLMCSVLPDAFKDILEAPVPLVTGVLTKPSNLQKYPHIEWVLLDDCKILRSDKSQSEPFAKHLKEYLKFAYYKLEGCYRVTSQEQVCAIHKFVSDVRAYWMSIIATVPLFRDREMNIEVVRNAVMGSVDEDDKVFVELMLDTQFFIKYVEEMYEDNN